jgi:DNA invertase Pin-like site-specific DNA recombinase
MNTSTAVYLRVSTQDQKLDSQELELRRYCKARSWSNPRFFRDKISGAKSTRPALDQLMKEIRGGKVKRLVCSKLDRLGRSLTHLALILDELNRLGVALICTTQGIDTSDNNPAGKLQLGVLMAVAEFEREIIRERTLAGLSAARERGVKLGRPATLERRQDDVVKLRDEGLGVRAISRELKMPVSSVHAVLKRLTA